MNTAAIRKMLKTFWRDHDGVTAIEYALLAALIFGAIVVSVGLLGDSVKAIYDAVGIKLSSVAI